MNPRRTGICVTKSEEPEGEGSRGGRPFVKVGWVESRRSEVESWQAAGEPLARESQDA